MQGPCALLPYISASGRSEVLSFLAELERRDATGYAGYLYVKDVLRENGTDIGIPHWKWLGDGLGEMRWRSHKRRLRIICSEEGGKRVVMLAAMAKKWGIFENIDRRTCLTRRDDFRSDQYDQEQRHYLYLARVRSNAGDQ